MSSCNCFDNPPTFEQTDNFQDKIEKSLCRCSCRFSVAENQSKFSIEQATIDELKKIKIDGFIDCSKTASKCDYLFIYHSDLNDSCHIFVELKGSDIVHAIEQLGNTIKTFYVNGYLKNTRVRAAIVSSRFPKADGCYRAASLKLHNSIKSKLKDFKLFQKNRKMIYNPQNDSYK